MPFPFKDFAAEGIVSRSPFLVSPGGNGCCGWPSALSRGVRPSFVVRSPMGGDVERLGESVALPLTFCVIWPAPPADLPLLAVPLAIVQWAPAFGALTTNPATRRPPGLLRSGAVLPGGPRHPAGRVEIVPTQLHYEAAYVAPDVALPAGWERQLDTADNPIFYTKGAPDPASYQAWLSTTASGRGPARRPPRLRRRAEGASSRPGVPGPHPGVAQRPLAGLRRRRLARAWWSGRPAASASTATRSCSTYRPRHHRGPRAVQPAWAVVDGAGCTHTAPGGWLAIQALHPVCCGPN